VRTLLTKLKSGDKTLASDIQSLKEEAGLAKASLRFFAFVL
jgi:hypothetical protein